jgi:hypothetical protein
MRHNRMFWVHVSMELVQGVMCTTVTAHCINFTASQDLNN